MVQSVVNGKLRKRESTFITTPAELKLIIDDPKKEGYFGKTFCARDKNANLWIAIDNRTGDAWTEQFECFIKMAEWFLQKEGVLVCQS